jgi:hypothetical protein
MQTYGPEPAPRGGVYAIIDQSAQRVVYVGRSRDVRRRLTFLLLPGGRYEAPRYAGLWLVGTDEHRPQRVLEQKALDTYSESA